MSRCWIVVRRSHSHFLTPSDLLIGEFVQQAIITPADMYNAGRFASSDDSGEALLLEEKAIC